MTELQEVQIVERAFEELDKAYDGLMRLQDTLDQLGMVGASGDVTKADELLFGAQVQLESLADELGVKCPK